MLLLFCYYILLYHINDFTIVAAAALHVTQLIQGLNSPMAIFEVDLLKNIETVARSLCKVLEAEDEDRALFPQEFLYI